MSEVTKYYNCIIQRFCNYNHDGFHDENIAINEAGSIEQLLAYLCEFYVIHKININMTGETLWNAFSDFEDYVNTSHKAVKIEDIYSSQIYNWYYGNSIHFLTYLILQPQLYTSQVQLEPPFIHSILRKMYDLLVRYKCSISLKDYYNTTPYESMVDIKSTAHYVKFYLNKPQTALLSMLLKHGSNITNVQKDILKITASRMHMKKKNAVKKIEKWWFEIINSPYTEVGKKMLKKRSSEFKMKYL